MIGLPVSMCCVVTGNAVQTVRSVDPVKLLTVRSTAFEAASVGAGSAATEPGLYILPPYLMKFQL